MIELVVTGICAFVALVLHYVRMDYLENRVKKLEKELKSEDKGMTNLERIINQNFEEFADECVDNLCFRKGKLDTTKMGPFQCDDCEFGDGYNGCDKDKLKAYLLAESEE